MTDKKKVRPQMHWSHLSCLMRCPAQYEFRYVKGIIVPPAKALHIGTATHKAVAHNLKHKAETFDAGGIGHLLKPDIVADIARDTATERVDAEDLWLTDEDAERGRAPIVGEIVDTAVAHTS